MIKLSSRHTMVVDCEGALRSLDFERVCADLYRCFRRCGIPEPWAADHIAMVVEEQLALRNRENPDPLSEADVHGMVAILLAASGYDDVRREYRQRNPSVERPIPQCELLPWDRQRVAADVEHYLPMATEQAARTVGLTVAALRALDLRYVSSDFIGQLALHIFRREATPAVVTESDASDDSWLVAAGQWPRMSSSEANRDLVAEGVLKLYPVSRFLPRVRLTVDLAPLGRALPEPILADLSLLPRVHRAARSAASLLSDAWHHVDHLLGDVEAPAPRLIVSHLDALVEGLLPPLPPRQAKDLRAEIRHLILSHAAAGDMGDTLVTFR